ncbi:uncharacterized protein PITG_01935 [Phytophthora infestans T30-4]|uniref:HTH CENPB-type domain-containing protein n=1 Tax=Phytophthora infestans (strain T30-4) TaxID=403677 RepID=D0MUG0_PHYIT|nr:uncharacterized protein PITG_01935 [Phytophthora infestans T30-4]EEY61607.1 hypothetical protein PITG_01935 [Phytophthora infestans T30-4]|eukprot:XP_002908524.1 hypothetical protein PITG_01935 [Phytophthora infestans T30-4]
MSAANTLVWSHRKLAVWAPPAFGLPNFGPKAPSIHTVSRLLKREAQPLSTSIDYLDSKKASSPTWLLLETYLVEQLAEFESRRAAIACASPKLTKSGWQHHFMARHGLKNRWGYQLVDIDAARRKRLELRDNEDAAPQNYSGAPTYGPRGHSMVKAALYGCRDTSGSSSST